MGSARGDFLCFGVYISTDDKTRRYGPFLNVFFYKTDGDADATKADTATLLDLKKPRNPPTWIVSSEKADNMRRQIYI